MPLLLGVADSPETKPSNDCAVSLQKRFLAVLTCVLLCAACRTQPPEDEVPATSAARSSLKLLSSRPALDWIAQPDVRFSRSGARITADTPREAVSPSAKIELPAEATGFTQITDAQSGMTIRQRLAQSQPVAAESARGLLVFHGAFEGFDVFQRPSASAVEDFITFSTQPEHSRVAYEVELAQGVAGLRLVEGVLEFVDASGDPRLRVGPAHILGANNQWSNVTTHLEGCAADQNPAAPWGRPVTAPGNSNCRVVFTWEDAKDFYPAVFDPVWTITVDHMVSPRALAAGATLGSVVVVAGGFSTANPFTYLSTAELYNEITGTWTPTGSMSTGRANFGMSVTTRGASYPRAVVAGGDTSAGADPSIEMYDPTTGMWSRPPASMGIGRAYPVVVTLADGRVAIIGGQIWNGTCMARLPNTVVYDPQTNTARGLQNMTFGRVQHTATLLPDGHVLVAGGIGDCCTPTGCTGILPSSELLDPNVGWTRGPDTLRLRADHAASLLPDGTRVLVAGGTGSPTSEIFDIPNTTWTTLKDMGTGRALWDVHMTIYNNRALVTGGGFTGSGGDESTNITLLYDPVTNTWPNDSPLNFPRRGHVLVKTPLGRPLVAGGAFGSGTAVSVLNSSELYDALLNGAACTDNGLCASRFCVDGVCCNTACSGSCNACNRPGSSGTCTVLPLSTPGAPACSSHLVCDGTSSSCPTECTSDQTCESGYFCLNRTCFPKRLPGQPCAGANQCQSDHCVDSVCCDTACSGSCDACNRPGSVGTCSNVPLGTPGAPACSNHLVCDGASASCPTSCTSDQTCESGYFCLNGTCFPKRLPGQPCDGANQCQTSHCVDSVCCTSDCAGSCDACNRPGSAGTCINVPSGTSGVPACLNHLVCDGTSANCPTACSNDQTCESGYFCLNGACQPKKPLGEACGGANQCLSDFCVDGVCCESACVGSCNACNQPASRGTCTSRPPGAAGTPACLDHLVCDGTSANCPTVCTSDQTCESGYFCLSGTCQPQGTPGEPCSGANQCQSGFCVDGVCCNNACSSACDACDVNGSVGTCSNLPPGTHQDACGAYLCSGTAPSCPTTCTTNQQCLTPAICINGQCLNPEPNGRPCTQANQCQSNFCVDGVCCNSRCDGSCESCNGSGTCTALARGTPGEPVCAPYLCDGTGGTCPNHCTADNQCATGATCQDGVCSEGANGHIGWGCGCGTASEGSVFLTLILLGLFSRRRSEVRP